MLSQRRMLSRALSISSVLLSLALVAGADPESVSCSDAELVVYSLTFETYWTRQKFPKQYPEYRPPAHWSKLIGMTHDSEYTLFRIGEPANRAIKVFAETGKADFVAAANHTFDEFYSPPIKTGAGRAEVNFFADGNHTMVSLAAKIIPSPDWFVGVDSLVLCDRGRWVDAVTVEAHPMDAGTDSGFTFTAPNWETDPPERITVITSKYPTHPANSFYYPALQHLPTIAEFSIKKKKLYQLVKAKDASQTEAPRTETTTRGPEVNETAPPTRLFKYGKSYKKRKMRKSQYNRRKCQWENWSQWSRCNATCGKGYAVRTRKSVSGKRCPPATEEKKCANYAGCYRKYFAW